MVSVICGLEITMIKITSVFVQAKRINACLYLHFSILNILELIYNFINSELASSLIIINIVFVIKSL